MPIPCKSRFCAKTRRTACRRRRCCSPKFDPLVDTIIASGSKAPANADFGDRLKHGLFGLVSVRRTDETTGSDLSSRVALVQSDLAHNDIVGAYAVWSALPADSKQRSDAWGASAKTSVEAITAARGLQNQSIGSLAAKKIVMGRIATSARRTTMIAARRIS